MSTVSDETWPETAALIRHTLDHNERPDNDSVVCSVAVLVAAMNEIRQHRRASTSRWIPWKPGDALPAPGHYWTTRNDRAATLGECLPSGWIYRAWPIIAYWSVPLPAPFAGEQKDE